MDAIILAGGIPTSEDPLYLASNGQSKALIDIAGKPMVQWVVDAIDGADSVGRIIIVGLPADVNLQSSKTIDFLPESGGMLANLTAGVERLQSIDPSIQQVLLLSCDVPTITSEMVDWRVQGTDPDSDLEYSVIEKETMDARFPTASRSYVRLQDVEVCGGDINVIHVRLVEDTTFWERMIAARKSPFRQAALLGFDLLFLMLIRRITINNAVKRVSSRLGLKGRAVISPYAEIGMDVDKPHQLELVISDLSQRTSA
ncbi:MAG TPA: nucleotidyltransferase family protein [Anaerolineales bacterium]|nr:nucleotidyltransferase family protein [Anaerolineales bacterium]